MTTFQEVFETVKFANPWAALWFPVFLMVVDFATGYINAVIKHERDSSKMRQGGGKKFAEVMCICVAQVASLALSLPDSLVYIVSLYISFMEFVSIAENIRLLGVKIPKDVDEVIDHINDDLNGDDDDEKDEEGNE